MLRRSTVRCAFRPTSACLLSAAALKRASDARLQINQLWANAEGKDQNSRAAAIRGLMDHFEITPNVPREEDISHAIGESFDRLLLMLVPLDAASQPYLERAFDLAGRNELNLSIRTIQHIFARVSNYSQAIQIFHTMRKCRVAMKMDAYYAMIYCLQRLEEESWCRRFNEELAKTNAPSSQMMDFIMNGCENQLIPESKPWLGRVMFADTEIGAKLTSEQEFDEVGELWIERYKNGRVVVGNPAKTRQASTHS